MTSYVNVANLYIVCAVGDLKHDLDMQAEDGYIAMEALSEVCLEVTISFLFAFLLTIFAKSDSFDQIMYPAVASAHDFIISLI